MSVFTKTTGLVAFMQANGIKDVKLLKNNKTGSNFVSFDGGSITARIANNVNALSADLAISWFTPEDEGEPSWMVHVQGTSSAEVLSTFSLDSVAEKTPIDQI
jgi:hypothetical protein